MFSLYTIGLNMSDKDDKGINVDVLKHIEDLSNQVNNMMESRAKNILRRYPISFGILILFGVISLNEGLKGVLEELGLLEINPWYLLGLGILVLIITGTIYKKLNK